MSSTRNALLVTTAIIVALGLGYGVGQKFPFEKTAVPTADMTAMSPSANAAGDKGRILFYRNMSGDTPPVPKKDSMGMDYTPVYESETKQEPGVVQLSPDRIQQLGVQTEAVARRSLAQTIHAVGTIQIDETRQTVVSPRFEGWIEKLYVDATGMQVKKGDPLFVFYSPDLTHTEAEYPFSHSQNMIGDMGGKTMSASGHLMNGTIEKLQSLAVPQDEIERLQREKTANYHMTLRAPADGTVMKKDAIEGMKFSPGDTLYHIVDLSNVWVMSAIYEQDLANIAVGQTVKITIAAFPGKIFEGKVAFIYPDIDKDTRTAKVRIDLPNPTGELRVDMYADVQIEAGVKNDVLTVPDSAVLNSGERQIALIDLGGGRFRPQLVKTGIRGGGSIEILDGLTESDRVVTSANFLIDSESNLRAALQSFAAPESKP